MVVRLGRAAAAVLPDGRVPGRRWRWVPWRSWSRARVTHAAGAFATSRSCAHAAPATSLAGSYLDGVLGLVANRNAGRAGPGVRPVSLVLRFRRSTACERAQLKWLSLAGLGRRGLSRSCASPRSRSRGTPALSPWPSASWRWSACRCRSPWRCSGTTSTTSTGAGRHHQLRRGRRAGRDVRRDRARPRTGDRS